MKIIKGCIAFVSINFDYEEYPYLLGVLEIDMKNCIVSKKKVWLLLVIIIIKGLFVNTVKLRLLEPL